MFARRWFAMIENCACVSEMRREFVGEGQLFYQYKRLNTKPADNVVFVLEKPESEDI